MNKKYRHIHDSGNLFHNALSLVDVSRVERPLVYVNQAFIQLTGYAEHEILGKNCRFLQGPGTDPTDVGRIRNAIRSEEAFFCDLLNYRKDGAAFFNRLVLLPIAIEKVPHFIGMQIDSSELLVNRLAQGISFDELKTSEMIKDKINNPLMNIWSALSSSTAENGKHAILERAFTKILDTVTSMPFR